MTSDILENENWRVKLYQLHNDGSWLDLGTGNACVEFTGLPDVQSHRYQDAAIVVTKEDNDNEVLIQSKIINDDIYERQGDSIIMWREPQNVGDDSTDIDYALSFQDTAGCISIWEGIENARNQLSTNTTPTPPLFITDSHLSQDLSPVTNGYSSSLPPVTASHLAELKLRLLSTLSFQKEVVVNQLLDQDEDYLKRLFTLFSELETNDDIDHLKILSEVFRHIVLLNDADLLDVLIQDDLFINLAAVMEYDPSLSERADHRTFLTSKCHLKVLLPSQDPKIAQLATTLYRLKFLRDYLIRPMIDESGVTALNSMITFTIAETCNKVFDSVNMLRQILSMLLEYPVRPPPPPEMTSLSVTSDSNTSSPDNVIIKASLLDPSISPVVTTSTTTTAIVVSTVDDDDDDVNSSLETIDSETTIPFGNGNSFSVNQKNDNSSQESIQHQPSSSSLSKKRKLSENNTSENSEVSFQFIKTEIVHHELDSQFSCNSWDYEDNNNNNNNNNNRMESIENSEEELFTEESNNNNNNNNNISHHLNISNNNSPLSHSTKSRNRKRRFTTKSMSSAMTTSSSSVTSYPTAAYHSRQDHEKGSSKIIGSSEATELAAGADAHIVTVSDPPTLVSAPPPPPPSRIDILGFLRELFFLSRSLPVDRRGDLYCKLMQNTGIRPLFFKSLQSVLCDRGSTKLERIYASECLACITLVCPVFLRTEIMEGSLPSAPSYTHSIAYYKRNRMTKSLTTNQDFQEGNEDNSFNDNKSSSGSSGSSDSTRNHLCILWVIINRVVYDAEAAVIEQLGDVLKVILDPERIDLSEKETFLSKFYDHYMSWVLEPFTLETPPDLPIHPPIAVDNEYNGQGQSALFTSRRFLCEVLALCIQGHQYRMRYFFMRNDLLRKILRLLDSPHRHLHIYALRVLRYTLASKDECFLRYIAKYDVLRSILTILHANIDKDNLLTSVIIEIVEYIRSENIRTMIDYIVETHTDILPGLLHIETFQKLQIKYEQTHSEYDGNNSNSNSSSRGGDKLPNNVESRHRNQVEKEDDDDLFYEDEVEVEDDDERNGSKYNTRLRPDKDDRPSLSGNVLKTLDTNKLISHGGDPIALINSLYHNAFEEDEGGGEEEISETVTGTGTGRRVQRPLHGVSEGHEGRLTSPQSQSQSQRNPCLDVVDNKLNDDGLTWSSSSFNVSVVDSNHHHQSANVASSSSESEDHLSTTNRSTISRHNSYNNNSSISYSIFDDNNEEEIPPPLPPLKPKYDTSDVDDNDDGLFLMRPKAVKKEKSKMTGGYFSLGLAKRKTIDNNDNDNEDDDYKKGNSKMKPVKDLNHRITIVDKEETVMAIEEDFPLRNDRSKARDRGAVIAADPVESESSLSFPLANKTIS